MSHLNNIFAVQDTNRVLASFWYHFSDTSGVDLDAFKDPEILDRNVAGTKHLVETVAPDFVKLMSEGLFHYQFNHKRDVQPKNIYQNLAPIDDNHPWLVKTGELVARQKQVIGDHLSFYNIFSPTTLLKWALVKQSDGLHDKAHADEALADAILIDRDEVKRALQVIAADVIKQVKVAIDSGADGIYYSTQTIQDERLNETDFEQFVAKTDQQVLLAANNIADTNILHICGNGGARNPLDWFKDYPAAVVNWSTDIEGVSLKEGKQIFKDRIVLGGFGNTKKDILYTGSQSDIQQYVTDLIRDSGKNNIIIGANCTVPRDIDLAHLTWAIQAVKKGIEA